MDSRIMATLVYERENQDLVKIKEQRDLKIFFVRKCKNIGLFDFLLLSYIDYRYTALSLVNVCMQKEKPATQEVHIHTSLIRLTVIQ